MNPCVHHTSAVVAAPLAINGRATVPAAARPKEPRSTERRVSIAISFSARAARPARGLRDRIFREDLLDPLERLLRRRLRRHAILDIDPTGAPNMLVLDLGIG